MGRQLEDRHLPVFGNPDFQSEDFIVGGEAPRTSQPMNNDEEDQKIVNDLQNTRMKCVNRMNSPIPRIGRRAQPVADKVQRENR